MADEKILIEKLNGTNYQSWKFNVKLLLMQKELWGIVDGSDPEPSADETEDLRRRYRTRSDKAYSIIALNVSISLQVHIVNTCHPKEAWSILEKQFSFVSITQLVRLTRKFYAASMEEGDDLLQHLTEMTQLAQNLRDLKEEISSKKFATVILGSLPSSYETFVTSLNARDADGLDWESVKGPLVEEYMKKKEQKDQKTKAVDEALMTRGGGRQTDFNNVNNRYPPSGRQNFNRGGPKECWKCGQLTHLARDCPNRPQQQQHQRFNPRFSRKEEGRFAHSFEQAYIEDDFVCAAGSKTISNDWFIDSAASKHMASSRDSMIDYVEYNIPTQIYLGDDSTILAKGEGTVKLDIFEGDKTSRLSLGKVLYVPDLSKNLLSVNAMTQTGAEVYFDNEVCVVSRDGRQITIGHSYQNKLYRLNTNHEYASMADSAVTQKIWHQRYGHLNKNYIDDLKKENLVSGMKIRSGESVEKCEPCILGKMKRKSFPKSSETKTSCVLELVHSDVCGPMEVESIGGSKYFMTLTDDYSRYTVVYFLRKKSEVLSCFKAYVVQMENLMGKRLLKVRTDNGGEYTSTEFHNYCKQMGEFQEFTNPYTPEQNGISERLNQTIVNAARSMLIQAKLPIKFWAEAINCAVYIKNRSVTSALSKTTPYQVWFGKKPDVSNLRVFGCLAYAHVPRQCRRKLEPKSTKCIFTGYPEGTKGYRLYNLSTGKFIRSRSVLFNENEFKQFNEVKQEDVIHIFSNSLDDVEDTNNEEIVEHVAENVDEQPADKDKIHEENADKLNDEQTADENVDDVVERNIPELKEYPRRIRRRPEYLCLTSDKYIPATYDEAIKCEDAEKWIVAMDSEIEALTENDTFTEIDRPTNVKLIGGRWVYTIKDGPDNDIYKARYVAKGYTQVAGQDYFETFAPTAKMSSLRILMQIAAQKGYQVNQLDVKTAYLHAPIDCSIFLEPPKGYNKKKVWKLNKSLYGLKQSGRNWNILLDEYLIGLGFSKSFADPCVYHKEGVLILIWVDDIIIASDSENQMEEIINHLKNKFRMKDLGRINNFIGIRICQNDNSIALDQSIYLSKLLRKFGMQDCKPRQTICEQKPTTTECNLTNKCSRRYKEIVGSLVYAMICTRPDLSWAVTKLSQHLDKPTANDWMMLDQVLRYIQGTKDQKLVYHKCDSPLLLHGYSDSDWGGDPGERRSTTGYYFTLAEKGPPVSWKTKKQSSVALSSCEAEYMALSLAAQEAIYLSSFLRSIMNNDTNVKIGVDNQGAIALLKNPIVSNRSKHIDIRYHFVREQYSSGFIDVYYIPTAENVADIMTKLSTKHKLFHFKKMLFG